MVKNAKALRALMLAGFIGIIYLLLNSGGASAALGVGGKVFYEGGTLTVQNLAASSGFTNGIWLQTPGGNQFLFNDNGSQVVSFSASTLFGLGIVPGGELVFFITSPDGTFFTGPASRNPDGLHHANIFDEVGGVFRVGFEDVFGGGDNDFNDAHFRLLDGGGPDPAVPIEADAGGPYVIDEGDPVSLDGTESTGVSLTYAWDVDGDGDYDENVSGVNPTVSAATMAALGLNDGLASNNVTLKTQETFLFWDFENQVDVGGGVSNSTGLSGGPQVTGFASQTGGGPAEFFGSAGWVHLTRPLGVFFPFIEFTTSVSIQLEGVEFQHFHNHNPGFPTNPSYDVQLQIDTGSGFSDIGAPLTLDSANNGNIDTMSLGSLLLGPGTYKIRWVPRNLAFGTDTGTEFFALNDLTLFGRTAVSTPTTLTINNVAPLITADNSSVSVNAGAIANNSGAYTDPSTGDNVAIGAAPVGATSKTGINTGTWGWSFDTTGQPLGTQVITVSADDLDGGADSATFNLTINNVAPTVDTDNANIAVDEGDTALNTGTFSDTVGEDVAVTASVGSVTKSGTNSGTWAWSFGTNDGPAQSQTVTIKADDGNGGTDTVTFALTVNNVAPSNVALTAVSDNINENDTAVVNGTFTDPGTPDSHTVVLSWGDGSPNTTINLAAGVLSFSASHQYLDDNPTGTLADDYVVKVESLTDSDGAEAGIGGDIFLTGHDPDFHAQGEAGAKNLLRAGLDFATSGTYDDGNNPNTKFLWVESRIPTPGGHRIGENGLVAIGLILGQDYDRANAAELPAVDFSNYTAIAVASTFGGLLTRAELDALIARSADIKAFVNNGGGIFASSECDDCGADLAGVSPDLFGYLPVNVSSINASAPFFVTPFGASLGLVNSDLQSPTHNSFADAGGLNIVDNDNAGKPTTLAGHVLVGEDALTEGLIITVNNVDPVASVTGASINEGGTASLTVTFSDVGTLDTHTASVNWGEGTVESLGAVTSPLNLSHPYGDNGSFTVTVTVTDDDGGSAAPTGTVAVANLDPTLNLDTTGAVALLGSQFFTGTIDVPQSHGADSNDRGSDDLTFDWSFAPDAATASNTYFNDGVAADPANSPDGVYPFGASDTASVTFAAPGVYTVAVSATDDDGGSASQSLQKLVFDDCDCTKSQGFWKHQFSNKGKDDDSDDDDRGNKIDDATLVLYLGMVTNLSGIFDETVALSTIADANAVLSPKKGDDDSDDDSSDDDGDRTARAKERALTQTLAAWLNFAKGAINLDELVDTNGDKTGDTTFGDLITEVESILSNPDATKDNLERAKDLAEAVNQHDKNNPECDDDDDDSDDDDSDDDDSDDEEDSDDD